jgi:hypothetical protein
MAVRKNAEVAEEEEFWILPAASSLHAVAGGERRVKRSSAAPSERPRSAPHCTARLGFFSQII